MSTIRIQAAALIDAPAERVYDILADYRDGHPRILPKPFFQSLDVVEGGVGEGTIFDLRTKLFGQERTMRAHVSEPQPGCVLVEKDHDSGLVTTFRVSPEHRGHHAHVTIVTDIPRSRGIKGLIEAWLLPRVLEKVYLAELRQLTEFARSRVHASARELAV